MSGDDGSSHCGDMSDCFLPVTGRYDALLVFVVEPKLRRNFAVVPMSRLDLEVTNALQNPAGELVRAPAPMFDGKITAVPVAYVESGVPG